VKADVFALGPATRIYLAAGVTDMRKGFEGLYGLVRDQLSCEPLSGHLFLFCNAQRNRLKVLVWDGSGLCSREGILQQQPNNFRLCRRFGR
jgi:transposase